MVYVSVTGLRLRGPWHAPRFWWHAIRSMMQARRAPGNLRADARAIDGVQHTLTVWRDRAAMRAFMLAGPHGHAMRVFDTIATGHTYGWEADVAPDWPEALAVWAANPKR